MVLGCQQQGMQPTCMQCSQGKAAYPATWTALSPLQCLTVTNNGCKSLGKQRLLGGSSSRQLGGGKMLHKHACLSLQGCRSISHCAFSPGRPWRIAGALKTAWGVGPVISEAAEFSTPA